MMSSLRLSGSRARSAAQRSTAPTAVADRRPRHLQDTDADGQIAVVSLPETFSQPQRRARRWILLIMIASDILVLAVSMVLAYVARQAAPTLGRAGDLSSTVSEGALMIGLGWLVAIALFGGYDTRLLAAGPELFRNILRACMGAAGIVGLVLFLTGLELSRVFFLVLFVVGPMLLLFDRLVLRRVIGWLRRRGRLRSRVLAVGGMPYIDSIARTLQRERWLGYDLIGAVLPDGNTEAHSEVGIPVVGCESELMGLVRDRQPAVLLFAAGSSASSEEFRRTAWQLEDFDIEVIVVPGLSEISSDRMSMRPVAGLPLVHLDPPRARDALKVSKRVFDIAFSTLVLILSSPVLLAIAVAVKLSDGGPVLFRQVRVGRDGHPFTFLKFRSMVPDAEARLAELRAASPDRGNDIMFKMAEDPRITRVGRILRRYSMDELPQLVNVLRGDMSLVGPRPALPVEVDEYDQDALRRLTVRPGITGLWQVSGRSDLSWSETVRLDLYYVDNWSFSQDVQILVKTVRAVLSRSGAY